MSPRHDRPDELESLDDALLGRYLAGSASAADRATIDAWIAKSRDRASALASLATPWARAADIPRPAEQDAMWARMASRLDLPASAFAVHARQAAPPIPPHRMRRAAGVRWRWAVLAAAATIVVVAVAIRGSRSAADSDEGAARARSYATEAGQRASVTLPDGTRFMLAPASTVRVPHDYAAGNRVVTLDGEALFTVVHDARHPFMVRAANTVATDVGTRFDVRAYASDLATQVVVVEGEVAVEQSRSRRGDAAAPRAIHAGDLATVADTTIAVTQGADVAARTAWTEGRLVFADEPLHVVLAELSRWYGVTVRLTDATVANRRVRGAFADVPLEVVLADITGPLGLRWVRAGNAVAVSPLSPHS